MPSLRRCKSYRISGCRSCGVNLQSIFKIENLDREFVQEIWNIFGLEFWPGIESKNKLEIVIFFRFHLLCSYVIFLFFLFFNFSSRCACKRNYIFYRRQIYIRTLKMFYSKPSKYKLGLIHRFADILIEDRLVF